MSVLKIDMTYQCTAECEHCRFRCTTQPQSVIEHDLAVGCIRELKELNDLRLVVILGGEPGLHPDRLLALVSAVRGMGLAARVETNAFWAVNDDAARLFLEPLYAMDTQIAISIDAFHAPFVPLERMVRVLQVSDEMGGDCWVDTSYVDKENQGCEEDRLTNRLIAETEQALGHSLESHYKGRIFYVGRSVDRLAGLVKQDRGIPRERCDKAPWWMDNSLETLELLNLDPDGYLSKGCGIAIGNVRRQPIRQMIESYDARKHPLFSVLLERGPIGLAEEAAEYGFRLQDNYADRCHLCQEAREFLRHKYPEYLAPAQHYRQGFHAAITNNAD